MRRIVAVDEGTKRVKYNHPVSTISLVRSSTSQTGVTTTFAAAVKGAKKARRGYAFIYGNADDWDVIRDCHEKSIIRTANGGELHVSSCHEAVDHVSEKGDLGT